MKSKLISILLFSALLNIPAYAQLDWDDWDTDQIDMGHRYGHSMVYDSSRNVIVLFGGIDEDRNFLGDTWEWDCNERIWVERFPKYSPPPMAYFAMAYDPLRKRIVVQGGRKANNGNDQDYNLFTWEWTGARWLVVSDDGPRHREKHRMVFDYERNEMVLYGGIKHGEVFEETWVYSGRVWALKKTKTQPPGLFAYAMAYDINRKVTVLQGGEIDLENRFTNKYTWEWDGENWANVASDGPGMRAYHDMVFDSARNACVTYGGAFVEDVIRGNETVYSDTWEWRGVKWIKIEDKIHPRPNARSRYGLAFDSSNNLVWMWDGLGDCRCRFNFYMWIFGPRFMILR